MESQNFRLHATPQNPRVLFGTQFYWDSFEETPIVQGGGKKHYDSIKSLQTQVYNNSSTICYEILWLFFGLL